MRSVLLSLLALFLTATAESQVNPHTQIRWPTSCSGSAIMTYNPLTNNCIAATGTAANPAGGTKQVQYNLSGIFAASSSFTFDPSTQTLGVNNLTPTSVNNELNVLAFGAKGDCSTDDSTAIAAALAAAKLFTPWASVKFPVSPLGNCYLTSTLQYAGQTLVGTPPFGVNPRAGSAGASIQGKASSDILHLGDPNSTTLTFKPSYTISYINFATDGSVDASSSFSHRWPGRWANDGAMTSGQATLTSPNSEFRCSDKGQAITVYGAGVAGANLTTTISNVAPCWTDGETQVVTLAATASTNVSGAKVYTSVAGISATQTIGNAAIAADNFDGNSAHWNFTPSGNNVTLDHVSFTVVNATTTPHTANIYYQGVWSPYALHAIRVDSFAPTGSFGIVQATPDTNPQLEGIGQDFQLWDGGHWEGSWPWISYNGQHYVIRGIQVCSANGPQVLGTASLTESFPANWTINAPEMECGASSSTGWRLQGASMSGDEIALVEGSTQTAYVDSWDSTYRGATVIGNLTMAGFNNKISNDAGLTDSIGTVTDLGAGNSFTTNYYANPLNGRQPTIPFNYTKTRGPFYAAGSINAAFLETGNGANFYPNANDGLWFPEDMVYNGITTAADSTAPFGKYSVIFNSNHVANSLWAWNGGFLIGSQIPAGQTNLSALFKCPSASGNVTFTVLAGATSVNTGSAVSCLTTYQAYTMSANLGAYSGSALTFSVTWSAGNGIDVAFVGFAPPVNAQQFNGASMPTSAPLLGTNSSGQPTSVTTIPTTTMPAFTGDMTNTAGSLATTVGKVNGGAIPTSASFVGTNSGGQFTTATGPLKISNSITPAAATASSCVEQTFTYAGLATTQQVGVSPPASLGVHLWIGWARVSGTNTLAIAFCGDATAGTPPSGTYIAVAF